MIKLVFSFLWIALAAAPLVGQPDQEKNDTDHPRQESSPQKGNLLYENNFATRADLQGWVMEGPGKVSFQEGWMQMFSPDEAGHHVFWCPQDFPANFVAEWELQNLEPDAGLCIIFFAATGINGEDVLDPALKKRDGIFSQYTKSDLNNYHISYYANADGNNREVSHLRKNKGFTVVQVGEAGIPLQSTAIHKIQLSKQGAQIVMRIDGRKVIDWVDDGVTYGPVLGGGKMGFRQMQWTNFQYRNFKVWEIAPVPSGQAWPRHTIDNSSTGADGVKLADINQDGRLDITTGWEEGDITKVYIHPGVAAATKTWPSVIVGQTPKVEDAVFMDMNKDGRLDVVSCTEKGSEKIFVQLAPKDLLNAKAWEQQILPASDGRMMWMYAEPLQVDGLHGPDLVAAGKGANAQLGWFEAPARAAKLNKWAWHGITPVGWVMSIILRDMDADGDTDIVITDRYEALRGCRWLENPADRKARKMEWTSHFIGGEGLEVMFMSMTDLDGDGQEEAVVAERTEQTIRIFTRKDKAGLEWQEQRIPLPSFTGTAKSVEVGDMNGDGIKDLVISTNTNGEQANGLIWLDGTKIGSATEADFQTISGAHNAKYDKVELWDIDEDGDLDILICEENFGDQSQGLGVVWYENQLVKK